MAWATREERDQRRTADHTAVSSSDPSNVALMLSARLVARGKQKALINMTSGLDMVALALTISREVFYLISTSCRVLLMFLLLSRMVGFSPGTKPDSGNVSSSMDFLMSFLLELNLI